MIPEDLQYTAEHEWIRRTDDGSLQVGITDFAQESLGDIVYVSLPQPGQQVTAGSPMGEVESTKSVSEIYAPVSGEVTEANEALESRPELLNSDPYGEGWIASIRAAAADGGGQFLSAAEYADKAK